MRNLLASIFILFVASCSFSNQSSEVSLNHPSPSVEVVPTIYSTAVFTPPPKNTLPSTQAVGSPTYQANTPSIDDLEVRRAFLTGVMENGDRFGALSGRNDFLVLYDKQNGFSSLRLTIQFPHPYRNTITSSQLSILTSGWYISILKYRPDQTYSNQPAVILDNLQIKTDSSHHNLTVEFSPKELSEYIGEYRAFTFLVFDESDNLKWQGQFSLAPFDSVTINWDNIRSNVADGIILGYPHSRHENEAAFIRQDQLITIIEPEDGFYLLYYMYDFSKVTGITATIKQEALAEELNIELFSFQADGDYLSQSSMELVGEVVSVAGVSYVYLPIDWLKNTESYEQPLYLRITDDDGSIIKEDFLRYVPHD